MNEDRKWRGDNDKVKRKKREEYIENDDQMSRILIELGSEDGKLYRLKDKKEFAGQQLHVRERLSERRERGMIDRSGHGERFLSRMAAGVSAI